MKAFASFAALFVVALATAAPPSADKLMSDARAKAKREGKNVMVVFHASWCGWCKRFDKMLSEPELKPAFEKSYVIVHVDVLENGEKESLENPGGEKLLETLGGKDAGLPFFAVVAPTGKTLITSLRTPGDSKTNTGHPAAPEEVAHFLTILKTTAPKMSAQTRSQIELYAAKK